jgi:TM2 domain-containing membrane protein YozV
MAKYYLSVNGQQIGPLDVNQLIPSGMTEKSMVWTDGMPSWAPAGSVPELAHLFAASSMPHSGGPSPAFGGHQAGAFGPAVSKQKVELFLMTHKEYFPADKLLMMEQALSRLDENTFNDIAYMGYKSPITALLLSAFGGILGFDRFYIGDTGMGVGKLLTGGGCGIWALIDIFMIQDATREKNFELISRYL